MGGDDVEVFDVALWQQWPSLFPEFIGYVAAPTAFAAVVEMMRVEGVTRVAHAMAVALDGSLVYRAFGVRVARP